MEKTIDKKTLWTKVKELVSSLRFWIITLGLIISLLKMHEAGALDLTAALDAIKIYLGVVVGVGTLDGLAVKLNTQTKA